jgi:hypothetical protein
VAESKPKSMAVAMRQANALINEAKALETGERQCKAIKKSGQRCKKAAIRGGSVCPTHGGSAPQVRAKAQKRLLAMVEPSLIRLHGLVMQEEHLPTSLGAIKEVLERAESNAIGAKQDKASGEKNTAPQIVIGIAVGGINPQPQVTATVQALPSPSEASVEAEVLDDEDDDGE